MVQSPLFRAPCYCAWLVSKLTWPEPHRESMGYCQEEDERHQTQQCRWPEGRYQSNLGFHYTSTIINISRNKGLKYVTLCVLNLYNIWVSHSENIDLFKIYIFFRCTCMYILRKLARSRTGKPPSTKWLHRTKGGSNETNGVWMCFKSSESDKSNPDVPRNLKEEFR